MSAPQQQGERTFAEVWCDSLDDLRKASTTKSGAERVIPRAEVVTRVAGVLRLSLKAVRERMHCETPVIEAEIAAREAAEYFRLRKTLDTPEQRGTERLGIVRVCALEYFKRYQFAYKIDGEVVLMSQVSHPNHEEAVQAGLKTLNKLVTAALQREMGLY